MKNTVVAIGAQRRAEPQGLKPESFCSFIAGLKACASTVGLRFHGWQSLSLATTRSRLRVDVEVGGADRDRTGGLLVANQALSQLSYSPTIKWWAWVELNYRPHPYQGCALAN